MSVFVLDKHGQAMAASLLIAQKVREYFKDIEHREEFEDWYKQRYNKVYMWGRITV